MTPRIVEARRDGYLLSSDPARESYWAQGISCEVVATSDAHELYARYGFTPLRQPDWFLEIHRPEVYRG